MKLSALLPKRYRSLLFRYRKRIALLALMISLYLVIDIAAGTLILVYLDPIAFSQKHPYIVLGGFVFIFWLFKRFFKEVK